MLKSKKRAMNSYSIFAPEINVFCRVFEQKSINAAARKLSQDPSNLSRTVIKLETELGIPLFVRHKTGLSATDHAERLYTAVLRAQESFTTNMEATKSGRKIRIGFYTTMAYAHFSSRMTQTLLEENLAPEFTISTSADLIELVKRRELDFILVHCPVKFPGVIARSVATEDIVLASRTGKEQTTLLVHPDMLAAERIMLTVPYQRRWEIRDYFVIARMLQQSDRIMGLLPESVFKIHEGLCRVRRYEREGKITAITWPGSIGQTLLTCIS